jgi:hypothetical protein
MTNRRLVETRTTIESIWTYKYKAKIKEMQQCKNKSLAIYE